jgi:hypothetical protein
VEAPEYAVDFPTLWVVPEWVEAHGRVPGGFRRGAPLELYEWQLWFFANHYRVRPDAVPWGTVLDDETEASVASAFHNRRSQIVGPQKIGKGPLAACYVLGEAVGPVTFTGWAQPGDAYDCDAWGCSCGWVYEYQPGEPMGRPWHSALIQIMATAEDQVQNTWGPLQMMIREGPLGDILRVGEEFIRCPNDGRIDSVTSSAKARLGQPITAYVQDETGLYTKQSRLIEPAETQRRGAAGMGGRGIETTNPPDPTVDSTGLRTYKSQAKDVFHYHRIPPASLNYKKASDRQLIHRFVYDGSTHVDLRSVEAEASELLAVDPGQAERFYGNRLVEGAGAAFNLDRFKENARPSTVVADRSAIAIGVDGARFRDALAIVGTVVETGFQWPLLILERPKDADDDYEHDFERADAVMLDAFDRFDPWRLYIDPQYIEPLFERWSGRWGEKRVIEWLTYRQKPMAFALRAYRDAIAAGDATNSGDPTFTAHIGNAIKNPVNALDDEGRPMWVIRKPDDGRKIDASMAGAISWECRSDALVAGVKTKKKTRAVVYR